MIGHMIIKTKKNKEDLCLFVVLLDQFDKCWLLFFLRKKKRAILQIYESTSSMSNDTSVKSYERLLFIIILHSYIDTYLYV